MLLWIPMQEDPVMVWLKIWKPIAWVNFSPLSSKTCSAHLVVLAANYLNPSKNMKVIFISASGIRPAEPR